MKKTKDGHQVFYKSKGYELGVDDKNVIYFAFPGETYKNPHMYLGKYDGAFGKNYLAAKKLANEFVAKVKDFKACDAKADAKLVMKAMEHQKELYSMPNANTLVLGIGRQYTEEEKKWLRELAKFFGFTIPDNCRAGVYKKTKDSEEHLRDAQTNMKLFGEIMKKLYEENAEEVRIAPNDFAGNAKDFVNWLERSNLHVEEAGQGYLIVSKAAKVLDSLNPVANVEIQVNNGKGWVRYIKTIEEYAKMYSDEAKKKNPNAQIRIVKNGKVVLDAKEVLTHAWFKNDVLGEYKANELVKQLKAKGKKPKIKKLFKWDKIQVEWMDKPMFDGKSCDATIFNNGDVFEKGYSKIKITGRNKYDEIEYTINGSKQVASQKGLAHFIESKGYKRTKDMNTVDANGIHQIIYKDIDGDVQTETIKGDAAKVNKRVDELKKHDCKVLKTKMYLNWRDSNTVDAKKKGYQLPKHRWDVELIDKTPKGADIPKKLKMYANSEEDLKKELAEKYPKAEVKKMKQIDADGAKEYSFSVKRGAELRKIKVSASTYEEALAKVKEEAKKLKFNGKKVASKFDGNKLDTRDF